ncbi:general substrate transporter [Violaceomyces palustris]|uniref:General substrate transporter n=1 Tax=Violaceomyces palustris TaxID=1673888 RepID=A0ACD0NMM1_9BASI|nr:general substrate transporter [Violaceomyces palustris]
MLKRVEDRPTPPCVYNWRVWALASIASFASCMIGYDSAFIGGTIALTSFKNDFGGPLSANTQANIVSAYQAGAFVGAFAGYPLGYFWGRKWGLMATAVIFTIASIIMTITSPSTGLTPIYVGRAIAGLAIGAASNLTPIYIAEISPSPMRGQAVGVYELGWQIGGVVGFWINYGVAETVKISTEQWRIPFAVQLIPGGLFAIGCFFLIESPRWLISRGRVEEAKRNLSVIRQLDTDEPYFVDEFSLMQSSYAEDVRAAGGDDFWAPFRSTFGSRELVKRLLFGSSLFFWQNATGINAVNYYSPTVFKSLGITGTNTGLLTTGVFGIIKTVGSLIYILFLVETVGRRNLLMIGGLGGALSMYYIGGYIAIAKPQLKTSGSLDGAGISALVFFYIWTVFYSPTYNPTPWVINAEMFPQHARTIAQTSGSASNWLYNFAISRATPYMFRDMGYGVYLFFASLMILSVIYIFFLLPETKGVPIESMNDLFSIRPVRHAHSQVMSELQARERISDGMAPRGVGATVDTLEKRTSHSGGSVTPDKDSQNEHGNTKLYTSPA